MAHKDFHSRLCPRSGFQSDWSGDNPPLLPALRGQPNQRRLGAVADLQFLQQHVQPAQIEAQSCPR